MPKPIHILRAGDDRREAGLIANALLRGGIEHVFQCAANRPSFLAALREFKPELILTEYPAPGFQGLESLVLARQVSPDVPVIVVADSTETSLALETIQLGAADCVFSQHLSQLAPAVLRAVREARERTQRRRAEVLLEVKCQQLSLQNEALRESEARFRQLAESIQEVFWMTDVAKKQTLYISPAYAEIWGRSCASLLAAPLSWLEAVHPDDRDRVAQAVWHKQATGDYDEQYRILRPDGSVRWIHDRAFCVRDETGAVYRLAGVAEDVTHRRQLEKQVLEISDREQARLGRDLHDGLCQLLVGIGFKANALQLDLETSSDTRALSAERIGQRITEAIKLTRNLSHGLCLANAVSENLGSALVQLAQNTTADYGILCEADCPVGDRFTPPDVATHIFRIAQEAVHNAVKHAKPTRICIRLAAEQAQAVLSVADDGCGIVLPPASARSGLGLEIMKHRAGVICGTLSIRTLPAAQGGGTVVTCAFPAQSLEPSA